MNILGIALLSLITFICELSFVAYSDPPSEFSFIAFQAARTGKRSSSSRRRALAKRRRRARPLKPGPQYQQLPMLDATKAAARA